MIDEKRLAEIREDADMLAQLSAVSEAELLALVECYEAARAYINAERTIDRHVPLDNKLRVDRELAQLIRTRDDAMDAFFALFPAATNG